MAAGGTGAQNTFKSARHGWQKVSVVRALSPPWKEHQLRLSLGPDTRDSLMPRLFYKWASQLGVRCSKPTIETRLPTNERGESMQRALK